jgi:arylsulfatase A-like enzyme
MGSGLPQHVKRQNPTLSEQGTDEDVVSAALEFLRINGRDRWFLYLHMMDVHEYLYDEQSALFGTTYSDVYDNSIRWTDGIIELLFQHLGAAGYLENTIIVITSDHGEAFQERGFEGHARKVFRETTEVPFIISLPFRLDPGVVVDSRTRGIDVWPTLLDLIGLETAADLDGRSLLPLLLSRARGSEVKEPAPTGIAHLDQDWGQRNRPARPTVAVTDGSLRYVRVDQGQRSIEQLFDRAQDPAELEDLSEHEQETVERLRAIAGDYLEQPPAWGKVPTKELDELELNHLRALGYALP